MTAGVFVFVGERPSLRAAQTGATWHNGRLCAKTLHTALVACGVDPAAQRFLNLWLTPGLSRGAGPLNETDELNEFLVAIILEGRVRDEGATVVGLGALVCGTLARWTIPHRYLVHPAARGAIRATARYHAHVRTVLLSPEAQGVPSHLGGATTCQK